MIRWNSNSIARIKLGKCIATRLAFTCVAYLRPEAIAGCISSIIIVTLKLDRHLSHSQILYTSSNGIETTYLTAIVACSLAMQPWALVTPASRGIGFALTRRILQTTNCPVVATSRKNQNVIKEMLLEGLEDVSESRLTVLPLDVLGTILPTFHSLDDLDLNG